MLRYRLTHPPLIRALAACGHNSTVLLADANYPHATGIAPGTELVHLNLRSGLVGVLDVLELVLDAVPVEAASVMAPDQGGEPPILGDFRDLLGEHVAITSLGRASFYEACRGRAVAVAVATGEERFYANILLTVGSVPPPNRA